MNPTILHITKLIVICSFFCHSTLFLQAQTPAENADATYTTDNRLFHIARSLNRNLVCYDANLNKGLLDQEEPIKVYWLNREENPGKTNGLSFIQKKLAYGYKIVSVEKESCTITLTAYSKRTLTIRKKGDTYACYIQINGELALLNSLYVKASPHNPLSVEYVELRGTSINSNKHITEKVYK